MHYLNGLASDQFPPQQIFLFLWNLFPHCDEVMVPHVFCLSLVCFSPPPPHSDLTVHLHLLLPSPVTGAVFIYIQTEIMN